MRWSIYVLRIYSVLVDTAVNKEVRNHHASKHPELTRFTCVVTMGECATLVSSSSQRMHVSADGREQMNTTLVRPLQFREHSSNQSSKSVGT